MRLYLTKQELTKNFTVLWKRGLVCVDTDQVELNTSGLMYWFEVPTTNKLQTKVLRLLGVMKEYDDEEKKELI